MDVTQKKNIFIYGYGNPGRQDDAAGVVCVEHLMDWVVKEQLTNIELDCDYQLSIEDANTISQKDIVIFIDASQNDINGFSFSRIQPDLNVTFTMHAVSPNFILGLCLQLYNKKPQAFLMQIKGNAWEIQEPISAGTQKNIQAALDFLKPILFEPEKLTKWQ